MLPASSISAAREREEQWKAAPGESVITDFPGTGWLNIQKRYTRVENCSRGGRWKHPAGCTHSTKLPDGKGWPGHQKSGMRIPWRQWDLQGLSMEMERKELLWCGTRGKGTDTAKAALDGEEMLHWCELELEQLLTKRIPLFLHTGHSTLRATLIVVN